MPSFCVLKYACDVCTHVFVMLTAKLNMLQFSQLLLSCSGLISYVTQASLQALAQDQLVAERIQMRP